MTLDVARTSGNNKQTSPNLNRWSYFCLAYIGGVYFIQIMQSYLYSGYIGGLNLFQSVQVIWPYSAWVGGFNFVQPISSAYICGINFVQSM